MIKRLFFIPTFILFVAQCLAQQPLTLQNCVALARAHNPELKNLNIEVQKSDIRYKSAIYNMYPEVEGQVRSGVNYGFLIDPTTNVLYFGNTFMNSFQLKTAFNVFSGFYNKYLKQAARSEGKVAQYAFDMRFNAIVLEMTYYYFQIWFEKQNEDILKKSLANYQLRKKIIEGQVNTEMLHRRHLYQVDYLISRTEADIISGENKSAQYLAQLKTLAGIGISDTLLLDFSEASDTSFVLFDFNTIAQTARNNFPDLKAGEAGVQHAEYLYKQSSSELYPRLLLEGQLGTKTSTNNITDNFSTQFTNNQNTYIGLNLSIPIFRQWNGKENKQLALLDMEAARNRQSTLGIELDNNVYQAHNNYNNAWKLYFALKKQYEAAEQEYRFAIKLFEVGNLNLFEFTDISERYFETEAELLEAHFNMNLHRKIIAFYTGSF